MAEIAGDRSHLEDAAEHGRTWIRYAGRAGYATKGVVYMIIGGMAAAAGWGSGGGTTGSEGAIAQIRQQPFGYFLLWLVTVGLIGFCVWRVVEAVTDPDRKGNGVKGLAVRFGYLFSAGAYGLLAWTTAPVSGGQPSSGGSGSKQDAVGWMLSIPGGKWILSAVGVGVVLFGIYQIYRGVADRFLDKFSTAHMNEGQRKIAMYSGRFGLTARGITFGVIGLFLVIAAQTLDSSKVKGLGDALAVLARQPYGQWVLLAIGIGLFCYGNFCLVQARHRAFRIGDAAQGT